jgi:site-specific DNA recombinase
MKEEDNENGNDGHKVVFAAVYARTSSPNQRFNHSIKEQVERCRKYCDERGWVTRYIFVDEGESGGSTDRPKFQLMLEKAREGKFDVIVFWKLDRFCRSLVDLVNVERQLRECSIGLCSVTEYLDTTNSVGRFNFRNLASVAELEREMIGERARIGLYALAKEHKWPNPCPPLGYDKGGDGVLIVNRREAELVSKIFAMYLHVHSLPQVAFDLNKKGIPTKKGNLWNARAVRDVLTNELYTGSYKVAGVEAQVKEYRIIDDELFKKVGETMRRYVEGDAKRPHMPEDRRKAKIDRIFDEYFEFLKEADSNEELCDKSG